MTPSPLKAAIHAAVPEIFALEEGCRIKNGGYVLKGGWVYWDTPEVNTVVDNTDGIEEDHILGRDIRQDDCAQVVKDKHGLADRWTPGYLDDQSEETIKWIGENLVDL